jgi:hypothetical protein
MSRLRVASHGEQGSQDAVDAQRVAIEVAADAALTRRGKALTGDQLDVLEAAAPFAGHPKRELARAVRGAGPCSDEDAEKWYPTYREDPARTEGVEEERELARGLCDGCPVKAQCLALDYAQAQDYGHPRRDGVQHIWGVRAGLGARDRRALLPLWIELGARLAAATVAGSEVAEMAADADAARQDMVEVAPAKAGAVA